MKSQAGDPWYVHAILYLVIAILAVILIKVAIIDPKEGYYIEGTNYEHSNPIHHNVQGPTVAPARRRSDRPAAAASSSRSGWWR